MTRPSDKHLDDAELDALVLQSPGQGANTGWLTKSVIADVQRHVESCRECSLKVQMHKSAQNEIVRLGGARNVAPGPECVEDVEWLKVAAGLLPETKTRELMKHAAQCGHCGPLLRNATDTLSEEMTSNEERMLASLSSSRPEWQKGMAQTLHGGTQDRMLRKGSTSLRRGWFSWPRVGFAAAALAAVIAAVWLGSSALRLPSAEHLLAQAYTERRTFDMRIPGAKYAPVRVERSNGGSNIDRPESLLKAEALIGENLRRNPNSPTWLQAKARADLLDDNYDSAITTLQRALDEQPDSPSLLTDLGSAYFLRAESAARPIDYGNAVEVLSKALAKSPDDPIALFNRAIACERMFLFAQAADDWEHYLRIDPQGGWSDEARLHLAAVKQKVQQHDQSQAQPLLTPAQIAGTRLSDSGRGDKIETRIEEYLHVAIIDWLPQAFPASPSGHNSNESHTALSALAEILRTRHEDSWLTELLSRPTGPQFSFALQALSAALGEDDRGDYSEARDSAHRAAHLFRSAANPAGELRAEGEEVYADHLLWEGERCLSLLRSMNESLNQNRYGWLQAQMSLEESNCANLVGDLGTYQAAIGKGISRAQAHNYPALFLRGLGFRALSVGSLGDVDTAFSDASEGLKRFWSGQVDIMKGYNFYYDLDAAADQIHLPNLQVILWREATTLIDRHPDILLRAMAHRWYGSAAYVANMPGLAAAEFSKASALFAASPQTPATTRDHMDAEVWLAQVEIRQGDVERAAARLQAVKPILDGAPSFDPEIGYYSALADVALRKTDTAATESALRSAIFIAEWALNSFRSENDRRHWAEESRNAYRDAVEWKFRQGDATSALEMWEWYRGAGLRVEQSTVPQQVGNLDITVPPDPSSAGPLPSPTLVEDRLPFLREETVIAYGVFSDGIAVWVYDNRGVYSQWIPTLLPAVQDQVSRFVRLCSDPASDLVTLRQTSAILYKLLVTPVENHIASDRTLVFEPDDFLRAIPWEALVDTKAHYLAERAAVLVTPGLYQAMRLRHSVPITADDPALVVSVPAPPERGLPPLADAEREAQAVADEFRAARHLEDSEATLASIRREIRGASVFHFAGHAVASPQRSGLMLGEAEPGTELSRLIAAGSLSGGQTEDLQLAVLSACNTKGDSKIGGAGTESLTESLLRAGVPHVVASRWNVDSRETAEFMHQFYSRLLAGSLVAEALHSAQLAVATHPSSSHPYYWAPFELEGTK